MRQVVSARQNVVVSVKLNRSRRIRLLAENQGKVGGARKLRVAKTVRSGTTATPLIDRSGDVSSMCSVRVVRQTSAR